MLPAHRMADERYTGRRYACNLSSALSTDPLIPEIGFEPPIAIAR